MKTRRPFSGRNAVVTCAFSLAILSCFLGLALCFVKSPQARSAEYLQISQQLLSSDLSLAYTAAMEAVRLDPSSARAWEILSVTLQERGEETASRAAQNIVARLQQNPGEIVPIYAMPAELRLSFLTPTSEGL